MCTHSERGPRFRHDREEARLARRPGPDVAEEGREIPNRGKTPGSGPGLRREAQARHTSEGRSQVHGPVGQKVGRGPRLRKARSGSCPRGGKVWVSELRNKLGQGSSLVGAGGTRSP